MKRAYRGFMKSRTAVVLCLAALVLGTGLIVHAQNLVVTGSATTNGNGYVVGNLGVGTTSPGMKLDVVGSIRASNSPNPNWGDVIGGNFNSNNTYAYRSLCVGNNSGTCEAAGGTVIGLYNAAATNNIPNTGTVFFNGGSVGIGTTAPYEKLEVNGSQKFTGWAHLYNGSSNFHIDAAAGGAMYLNYFSSGMIYFGNGASGVTGVLNSSGNLGLGTTSPAYRLEAIGDIRANGGWLRTTGSNGWYNDTYGGGWNMSDSTWIRSYGGKQVYMDNLVSIAGSLGVGTTAPAHKLHVVGNVYGQGIVYGDSFRTASGEGVCRARMAIPSGNCAAGWTMMGGQWNTSSYWGLREDGVQINGSNGWMQLCCK